MKEAKKGGKKGDDGIIWNLEKEDRAILEAVRAVFAIDKKLFWTFFASWKRKPRSFPWFWLVHGP